MLLCWDVTLVPKRHGGHTELLGWYPGDARDGGGTPPGARCDAREGGDTPVPGIEGCPPVRCSGEGNPLPRRCPPDPKDRPPPPPPRRSPGASCVQQQRRPGSPSLAMAGAVVPEGGDGRTDGHSGCQSGPFRRYLTGGAGHAPGGSPGAAPGSQREGPGPNRLRRGRGCAV